MKVISVNFLYILDILSKVSEQIAIKKAENLRRQQPQCRLMLPTRETPAGESQSVRDASAYILHIS